MTTLEHLAHGLCEDARIRHSIRRHCSPLPPEAEAPDLDTRIPPGCQMLGHSLRHHQDPNAAVSQYFNVALQQYHAVRQILHHLHGPTPPMFLDFACGYGRLLRFLRHALPASHLHAAEIQEAAVRYVTDHFGIPAMRSTPDPKDFHPPRHFDVIWVASLFSHLPEPLFLAWLERLYGLLTPDGILCFSVHDRSLLPPGLDMPDSGILFGEGSEIPELGPALYGTAYVSESFVARAIERVAGSGHPWVRLPKSLAQEQDIYVLSRNPERALTALQGFRRGPWGWVDERRRDGAGLYLRGWAASLDDGPLDQVEIRIDGTLHACPVADMRQDVADHFQDPRLAGSGWSFHLSLAAETPPLHVEVSARDERGERALLYTGIMA
ncbi:class I SAM-dependent methyltransferase [Ectothiorhodospira shaposhnikovii]|uniref:class I SAM-dependent methyltransferase n=1 Tax=Ectothiorhodospira shaposhnikovii TaxID=1054 RepID=UPI001F5BFD07|nr:class I SAM-dependent methyltransferase [Ectothiorhodospira shaposhnikovii]